ncbi:hypothetical protein Patl1_34243 [Pistacia atlantica]|uniref:Uncharacterized protein n=1 Tax=Pistacia atlantica TaxID=434234 RepID=A0ACC0ZS31_9ROSI|nr:hypothetical protein Patl1_34243 [Pistacia atlantica]
MDRISELPDFIIHTIMSHLSPKKVAQTSILSKRWNYLRTSFPILEFNQNHFMRRGMLTGTGGMLHEKRFVKFVDVTLGRFCRLEYCMEKFRLKVCLFNLKISSRIDEWIRLAVEKEVKEFDISPSRIYNAHRDAVYTLPQTIFSAKLLTTLRLSSCKIEQPSDTLMLCSLKSLTLKGVCINEQMVQKFTSECPLLEDLLICSCWGLKNLRVSKALKLKFIQFHNLLYKLVSVEIIAPSLQVCWLVVNYSSRLCIDMAGCTHLKELHINGGSFTDQDFHHLISKFPFLEHLYVYGSMLLERIMISTDRLKRLKIRSCPGLKAIHLDTPNLISFSYYLNWIPIAVTNAPCSYWKVFIRPYSDLDTSWFINLTKFLGVANQIEGLFLSFTLKKISFNLEGVRESFASFRCQVPTLNLSVNVCAGVPFSDYRALLDGLLWSCCPGTLHVTATGEDEHKFLQWLYEELRNRCVNCCNSHNIKCWRHYLKDVKILSTLPMEDRRRKNRKLLNRDDHDLRDVWPINRHVIMCFDLDWVQ